jgi:hypothetical protein
MTVIVWRSSHPYRLVGHLAAAAPPLPQVDAEYDVSGRAAEAAAAAASAARTMNDAAADLDSVSVAMLPCHAWQACQGWVC